MKQGFWRILYFFIIFLQFDSCSYFLREPGRPPKVGKEIISDSLRKVYIHNFQNHSYGPALHTMLTQALKSEIDRRGRFIQTRDKSEASFRIYGGISHYQKTGNILDSGNQEMSSEITIVVKLEIQEAGGERIALERDEIMSRAYYSDQLGYRESEEQAQARLVNNLAIRLSQESENAWYYHIKEKYYKEVEKKE
jgi:hypothetical protein